MAEVMKIELSVLTPSEFSKEFHQGMVNRMEVSFHKYGYLMDAVGKIDEIKSLRQRLQRYEETGNTEWLMDVANIAMIEFMHRGPEAFRATESHESPGLTWVNGEVSARKVNPTEVEKAEIVKDFYKGRAE
jgi:hypothetical protein